MAFEKPDSPEKKLSEEIKDYHIIQDKVFAILKLASIEFSKKEPDILTQKKLIKEIYKFWENGNCLSLINNWLYCISIFSHEYRNFLPVCKELLKNYAKEKNFPEILIAARLLNISGNKKLAMNFFSYLESQKYIQASFDLVMMESKGDLRNCSKGNLEKLISIEDKEYAPVIQAIFLCIKNGYGARKNESQAYGLLDDVLEAILSDTTDNLHPVLLGCFAEMFMKLNKYDYWYILDPSFHKTAAKGGHAPAQNNLAVIISKNKNPNKILVFNLFSLSAKQGHGAGLYNLALCFKKAYGCEQNLDLYENYLRDSAEAGYDSAMERICEDDMSEIKDNKDKFTDITLKFRDNSKFARTLQISGKFLSLKTFTPSKYFYHIGKKYLECGLWQIALGFFCEEYFINNGKKYYGGEVAKFCKMEEIKSIIEEKLCSKVEIESSKDTEIDTALTLPEEERETSLQEKINIDRFFVFTTMIMPQISFAFFSKALNNILKENFKEAPRILDVINSYIDPDLTKYETLLNKKELTNIEAILIESKTLKETETLADILKKRHNSPTKEDFSLINKTYTTLMR